MTKEANKWEAGTKKIYCKKKMSADLLVETRIPRNRKSDGKNKPGVGRKRGK